LTFAIPLSVIPSSLAAEPETSTTRPGMYGPRSLTRTVTDRPVATFVTRNRVPNGTYGELRSNRAYRTFRRSLSVGPLCKNWQWSRLAADVLVTQLGGKRFTWGGADLQATGTARATYIATLQAADNHDFGPLLAFARS